MAQRGFQGLQEESLEVAVVVGYIFWLYIPITNKYFHITKKYIYHARQGRW
jgi:hypothetical protein